MPVNTEGTGASALQKGGTRLDQAEPILGCGMGQSENGSIQIDSIRYAMAEHDRSDGQKNLAAFDTLAHQYHSYITKSILESLFVIYPRIYRVVLTWDPNCHFSADPLSASIKFPRVSVAVVWMHNNDVVFLHSTLRSSRTTMSISAPTMLDGTYHAISNDMHARSHPTYHSWNLYERSYIRVGHQMTGGNCGTVSLSTQMFVLKFGRME
jgi:hypothetical protein